jgi:5-methylcytosine-specific restriction endonuclease McrA
VRRAVYERDEGRCYLCGEAIDRAESYPSPRSLSLDHALPYAEGGTEDLDNLKATHLRCNLQRARRESLERRKMRVVVKNAA